jgi:hypothetical protein
MMQTGVAKKNDKFIEAFAGPARAGPAKTTLIDCNRITLKMMDSRPLTRIGEDDFRGNDKKKTTF